MSKISPEMAEIFASQLRSQLRVSNTEPVNVKTVVRMLGILTLYRPLSTSLYGLSMKSADGKWRFMLVNSDSMVGRQNFTIAHELYHLYFDENPQTHFCKAGQLDDAEKSANVFAGAFLMPKLGLIQHIPDKELLSKNITINTILNLEALFGVSHTALLVRLKELKFISEKLYEYYTSLKISVEATRRGFDTTLYHDGNAGLVIGDFGVKARELYEKDIISEGHYWELLNMIGYGCGEGEDCTGC